MEHGLVSIIHKNTPHTFEETIVIIGNSFLPLNTAEGVLVALFGLNFKVKGACGCGASGKVHTSDLLKAQVHRGLVNVDEASLQRIQQP